jgi:putative NADH-flavin reductase
MPSRILVVGATGGTGREVVLQALAAGHDVTALARTATRLPIEHPKLRTIDGALPQDAALLSNAMAGQDVVISALGRGRSLASQRLIEQSVPAVLRAMRAHGVRRLIFTSAIGVGDAVRDIPFLPALFARTLLRGLYADKIIGEGMVRESGLDWTIAQPAGLTDGIRTERYQAAERLALSGVPKISRADVAHFLLAQIEDGTNIGKTLVLAY